MAWRVGSSTVGTEAASGDDDIGPYPMPGRTDFSDATGVVTDGLGAEQVDAQAA